jgi:hypothetical protein
MKIIYQIKLMRRIELEDILKAGDKVTPQDFKPGFIFKAFIPCHSETQNLLT